MKNKFLILSMMALVLCSCSKTKELYKEHAYNSSNFDENYYTEWNGIDKLEINEETTYVRTIGSDANITPVTDNVTDKSNLGEVNSSFKYGYLSKLYDGRLKCDGYYQLSRVQLNKTGYGTFFPKQLKDCSVFGISIRGGSTCAVPLSTNLKFNIHISFYIHLSNLEKYNKVTYNLNNVSVTTDSGGSTQIVSFFNYNEINGAVGMSMTFEMNEPTRTNLTDDMTNKEKEHVALMLYEVLLPESTWL